MAIEISDEFIRLWDANNPKGLRIEAMGGPKDNLRITGTIPVEISLRDSNQLSQALDDFAKSGFL